MDITTLDDLIAQSGDARLISYSFSNGKLDLYMDFWELDEVKVSVRTDVVRGAELPFDEGDAAKRTCHLSLTDLDAALRTENGIYIPASDFAGMMEETRRGLSLAYGKKATEARWLLSLVGSTRLVVCLVAGLGGITWVLQLPDQCEQ